MEEMVTGLKLFNVSSGDTLEITDRAAVVEIGLQGQVEADMEALLGVRFLAIEYSTAPLHGGRIDSLGLDEVLSGGLATLRPVFRLPSFMGRCWIPARQRR
ncbi:hypothetical protein [Streptomyces cyaneogriseus]|uniref:hypothetical protein n=1 Tax=Streptomyces cyaneogriseus TaxID=68192 RepID=UPI000B208C61|nr:hypothetical protein [Streptomyces cyaneogriseus]